MTLARTALAVVVLSLVSFTASGQRRAYADEIRIAKRAHTLSLVRGSTVWKTYRVALGSGGEGPKQFEGDARTPVGEYTVVSRWKGLYHRFLNVSYPNDEDRARFADLKSRGLVPDGRGVGFGIGIHGTGHASWNGHHKDEDWTHGCIALDDDEIDEVAGQVRDGTRIVIVE